MTTDNTRRAVRRELEAAATAGLHVSAFTTRTLALLHRVVRFDACCLATVDPTTRLITGAVARGLDESRAAHLFEIEYGRGDVSAYRALAQTNTRVATLDAATNGDPAASLRFDEILKPLGLGHELRVLFSSEGRTWGVAALMRGTDEKAFGDDELRSIATLSETVADGLRASILVEVSGRAQIVDSVGPAVVVIEESGEPEMITPAAAARLVDFPGYVADRLPDAVLVVVAAARGAGAAGAKLRVRGQSGAWWVVSATSVTTGSAKAKVVATVEEARTPDVVPLVVAALGLSARERDVVVGVLEGRTSGEVADDLGISTHTVNDHLKSIFAKAGVHSRRELVARVFFEHYAPRIGSPLATGGWFEE